jgi:hypothetical protein
MQDFGGYQIPHDNARRRSYSVQWTESVVEYGDETNDVLTATQDSGIGIVLRCTTLSPDVRAETERMRKIGGYS